MLRLVLAPDGRRVVDFSGKLPGEALWIAATREALAEASGGDASLLERVEAGLVRRIQDRIALARKAGLAVCGFAKVEQVIKASGGRSDPRSLLLLEASDAGASDGAKLLRYAEKYGIPVASPLTREELGKPFGREAIVHLALQREEFAAEILKETRRLAGFRKKDAL